MSEQQPQRSEPKLDDALAKSDKFKRYVAAVAKHSERSQGWQSRAMQSLDDCEQCDVRKELRRKLAAEREKVENLHTILGKKRTEIKDLKEQRKPLVEALEEALELLHNARYDAGDSESWDREKRLRDTLAKAYPLPGGRTK